MLTVFCQLGEVIQEEGTSQCCEYQEVETTGGHVKLPIACTLVDFFALGFSELLKSVGYQIV